MLVNRGVTLVQQAGLFVGAKLDTAISDLGTMQTGAAAIVSPAVDSALGALIADLGNLKSTLAATLSLNPVTDNPTTLSALLAEKLDSASSPHTVRDYFESPNALFAPLARAIMTANAKAAADWRRLQLSVAGLPQFWQGKLIAALKEPRDALATVYNDGQNGLIKLRNKLAEAIDTDLLSLTARRAVFVNPAYAPAAQLFDVMTPSLTLVTLETKDRLAEEGAVLTNFAAYQPPAAGAPDLTLAAFLSFARSWGVDPIGPAAPLQIVGHIADLASEVLRGEILSLVDVSAFRDALLDAVAKLVPTKASFSYDFSASVDDDTGEDSIFQAAPGGRFTLSTRIEVDLLNSGSTSLVSTGALGPFSINLVGGTVKALKLRFSGAKFESRNGGAPRFDISYDNFEVGEDLDFVKQLEAYLTPSDGSGFHIGPSPFGPGLEVGYGVNLGGFEHRAGLVLQHRVRRLGGTAVRHSPRDVQDLARPTHRAVHHQRLALRRLRLLLHLRLRPRHRRLRGGVYVRRRRLGRLRAAPGAGAGAGRRLYPRTETDRQQWPDSQFDGDRRHLPRRGLGQHLRSPISAPAFTSRSRRSKAGRCMARRSSLLVLVLPRRLSLFRHRPSQPGLGRPQQPITGRNDGPLATMLAALALPGRISDAYDDLVEIAANPTPFKAAKGAAPKGQGEAAPRGGGGAEAKSATPLDVVSIAQCQSQNWKVYSSYFDFSQIDEEA